MRSHESSVDGRICYLQRSRSSSKLVGFHLNICHFYSPGPFLRLLPLVRQLHLFTMPGMELKGLSRGSGGRCQGSEIPCSGPLQNPSRTSAKTVIKGEEKFSSSPNVNVSIVYVHL